MKVRPPQPGGGRLPSTRFDTADPSAEALFWVRMTDPHNCTGLRPGQNLRLDIGDSSTVVLDGVARLGVLESAGHAWIRDHRRSLCVFVKYESDHGKRFQVKITAL